jgi:hypothetical protein
MFEFFGEMRRNPLKLQGSGMISKAAVKTIAKHGLPTRRVADQLC